MSTQKSLLSFFSPKIPTTPRPSSTPKGRPTTEPRASSTTTPQRGPLKRINEEEELKKTTKEEDPITNTPKRRKVCISSDSESASDNDDEYEPSKDVEEEEDDADMEEEDEETPQKVKSKKRSTKKANKDKQDNGGTEEVRVKGEKLQFDPEMATSFIGSFRRIEENIDERVKATMEKGGEELNEMTEDKTKKCATTEKRSNAAEGEFAHETLIFLKPERIKDANGNKKDSPEYDPTTLYVPPDFIQTQTPGHQQWWHIKSNHFDTVLLFKVGKFYELYHMDATIAVKCLNLAYMKGNFAHCGFPESAYGRFADQLVERGYKVARVEQTETPDQLAERQAKMVGKKSKVVRREVCRVTTVGTRTYDAMDSRAGEKGEDGGTTNHASSSFLVAIKETTRRDERGAEISTFGVAMVDTSIGKFLIGTFTDDCYYSHLRTIIARHPPAQVLIERNRMSISARSVISSMVPSNVPIDTLTPNKQFIDAHKTVSLLLEDSRLGSDVSCWPVSLRSLLSEGGLPSPSPSHTQVWSALGALLSYLSRCLIDIDMVTMRQFELFDASSQSVNESNKWTNRRMVIDGVALEQLSLVPLDYAADDTNFSLFNMLNKCTTPFGSRILRSWVCAPSCDESILKDRQDVIEWMMSSEGNKFRSKVEPLLDSMPDLERLLQRIHSCGLEHRARNHPDSRAVMFEGNKYARKRIIDLVSALDGFRTCQKIGNVCAEMENGDIKGGQIKVLSYSSYNVKDEVNHFKNAFDEKEAEKDGKIIPREGVNVEYDEAVKRLEEVKGELEEYRRRMEQKLKVKVVFVSSGKDKNIMEIADKTAVPSDFEMRGQRKGYKRYCSTRQLELQSELNEAENDVEVLLKDASRKMFEEFDKRHELWTRVLDNVSTLDVLISLSKYAEGTGVKMCRPHFIYHYDKPVLEIVDGFHPSLLLSTVSPLSTMDSSSTTFIPNTVSLGGSSPSSLLLTGPNMGGKSTLMRQVAVLAVLAHIGSFVPARSMKLTPIDRIFTRIGASDRLVCGQSTFFVEMNESAIALRDATKDSLAIFDELGRGTGTVDGQALAWAILDEMTKRVGNRCVFSTHYHGLCERVQKDKDVLLMHMGCIVENDDEAAEPTEEAVTFLYRLMPGICPRSFGFNAARLAGIEEKVIRASWKAAKRTFGDEKALKRMIEAAEKKEDVRELRRLVEACFV